jgi:hypothetical protein
LKDWTGVSGTDVRSSDGAVVGQVSAVHVAQRSREPLLVQIYSGRAETDLIVPVANAVVEDGILVVPYNRAEVEAGPAVAPDAILSVGEIAYILAYYRAGTVDAGGAAVTDRATAIGDVGSQEPDFRPLPPIVVIKPGLGSDDRDDIS